MRRFLTLLACLLTAGLAMADRVSEREALKKAQAFMPGERFEMKKYASPEGGQTEEPPFYIFNVENGRGYVLVSAEDRTTAILGYSTNGNIDLANIPDNLRYWLDFYAEEINAVKKGTLVATRDMAGTRAGTRGTRTNIAPLLKTTWNQGRPYNLMCPDGKGHDYYDSQFDSNNRCVTGCVATAVAQVMYYHQWPQQTAGIPAYSIYINGYSFSPGELPATTLEWDKMKVDYDIEESGEEAWAVAKLMRYVGQALSMSYNTSEYGGSAASVSVFVMMDAFNYSKNSRSKSRNNYTTTQWENMVYDELDNGRPVLYSGRTSNSGHQFVCDGYQDGLFHLNWGWGGGSDGFYILSIADPDGGQYIGGSTGAYKYGQSAIFNLKPATPDEVEIPVMRSAINTNFTPAEYTRASASEDFTIASLPGRYYYYYNKEPISSFNAEIGWGLYEGEQLKRCFVTSTQELNYSDEGYINNNLTDAAFGADLADGRYQLRQIFRKAGSSDEWTLMDNCGISYYVAEISSNTLTIRIADTSTQNFRVNSINISDEPAVGMDMDVKVNITNTSDAITEDIRLWTAPTGTTSWTKVATQTAYFDPDESGDVTMRFQPSKSGTFTLKVTTSTSDEALATQDFTVANVVKVNYNGMAISCIPDYGKAVVTSGGTDYTQTSVTIPASVTANGTACRVATIAEKAFYNWYELQSIDIPEGVETIGDMAFMYCFDLRRIILPSTLKSIGEKAFYRAEDLSEVISHIQVPFAIDENTFKEYDFDLETTIPSRATLYVPFGTKDAYLEYAGWTAFKAIEEGEILEAAVGDLNYKYYTGSKKAVVIAGNYSSMTTVEIPASVTIDGVGYTVKAIDAEVFSDCKSLQTVSLPDGLEEIGNYAFMRANKIKDFAIPSHLKNIGNYAFWNCYLLENIILPEGLETIGSSAFGACHRLQKLVLPSTLSSIGQSIISNCRALTTVVSHIQKPYLIDENTFTTSSYNSDTQQNDIIPSPATLFVPIGTIKAYQAIKGWTMFNTIEEGEILEATVDGLNYSYSTGSKKATVIAGDYEDLESLVVPDKVTIEGVEYTIKGIGANAFMNCGKLTSISLPDGLETIGNQAFMYDYFADFVIPSHLKSIGDYAFFNNGSLKSMILPNGLESIGSNAFAYCYRLNTLVLPSSLKSIEDGAFMGEGALTKVTSRILDPSDISDDTFTGMDFNTWTVIPSTATITVPKGTKSKYENCAGWSTIFQGRIEETNFANGDANGSGGDPTPSDAVDVISFLLGQTPDGFDAAAVDMNGDGVVTVTDIILLIITYSLLP